MVFYNYSIVPDFVDMYSMLFLQVGPPIVRSTEAHCECTIRSITPMTLEYILDASSP
jgi:hypothetical protein